MGDKHLNGHLPIADPEPNGYGDRDSHGDRYSNGNGNGDRYSHGDSDSHSYSYSFYVQHIRQSQLLPE